MKAATPWILALAAAGLAAPAGAQTSAPFDVGRPLRITYCEADCAAARLTATGRLVEVRPFAFRLQSDARLRLRIRRDTTEVSMKVVALDSAGVTVAGRRAPLSADFPSGWERTDGVLAIPFDRATRTEARLPRTRWRGAGHGAMWGGLAGVLAAGAAMGMPCGGFESTCVGNIMAASLALLIGPPVGAIAGAVFPGRTWTEVPTPSGRQ